MASKELTISRFGGSAGLAKMEAYRQELRAVQMQVGTDDGKDILRCDKETGEWVFGQEATPLGADELAINPMSFQHGYIAFEDKTGAIAEDEDGEPCNIFVTITTPLPRFDSLPLIEQPKRGKPTEWKLQMGFNGMIITGPHAGTEVVFKPTSRGGHKLVSKLSAEILRRWDGDLEDIVPVVELFSDSYTHKTYGKVITPAYEILDWITMDDDALGTAAPAKADEPQKNPKAGEKTRAGHPVDERKATTRKTSAARAREEAVDVDEEPEEDEAPARGRRARGVDAPTDKVARGARRSREEPEDEAPARGRGRPRREEPEDEAPARGRGRARDEEPEDEAPVRGRRAAAGGRRSRDEDEAPARAQRRAR